MDDDRNSKTAALTEVNTRILEAARESVAEEEQWEFFCECGRSDCHERVLLALEAYSDLHDRGDAVLAPGHQLSQLERARRLGADSEALRRQADHQLKRAKRNLGEI